MFNLTQDGKGGGGRRKMKRKETKGKEVGGQEKKTLH